MSAPSPLGVDLGKDTHGQAVRFDLRKGPHVLVSGTTGSGKSVAIHAMLTDILTNVSPGSGEVQLCLVDPKRVELGDYEGLPCVTGPDGPGVIYRDPRDAIRALSWVLGEVERRFGLMEAARIKDVSGLPGEPILLVVVDELADLVMAGRSLGKAAMAELAQETLPDGSPVQTNVEASLARILQVGRAAGVHMVLATQRPSSDVVSGLIKTNVPTRLCFALQNANDSRVALGRRGAEELGGKGDGLFLPVGSREAVRFQGKFMTDEARDAALRPWRALGRPEVPEEDAGPVAGNVGCLADMPMPEPFAVPEGVKLTKRQYRRAHKRWAKQARRVDAWNGSGVVARRVFAGLSFVVVAVVSLSVAAWMAYGAYLLSERTGEIRQEQGIIDKR